MEISSQSRSTRSVRNPVAALAVAGLAAIALPTRASFGAQAELPTPRQNAGVVELNGHVYVIGGFDATGTSSALLEQYDVASDRWRRGAPMPTARGLLGTTSIDGRILLLGGSPRGPGKLTTVEAYDPVRDHWTPLAAMPTARQALSAVSVGDRIYALGGWGLNPDGSARDLGAVEVYDPVTDRWSAAAALPTARSHMAAAVVNGRIYTIGGWTMRAGLHTALGQVEVYDPETDSWARAAGMPTPRWLAASTLIDGRIYALGGWAADSDGRIAATATVEVFDPATGAWSRDADLATARAGHAAVTIGAEILVLGGKTTQSDPDGGSLIAGLEAYVPSRPAGLVRIAAAPTRDPAHELPDSVTRFADGGMYGTVTEIQEPFGNLATSFVEADLERLQLALDDRLRVRLGDEQIEATLGRDFSDVARGAWVAMSTPSGTLMLGMNFANAARTCACGPGTILFIAGLGR